MGILPESSTLTRFSPSSACSVSTMTNPPRARRTLLTTRLLCRDSTLTPRLLAPPKRRLLSLARPPVPLLSSRRDPRLDVLRRQRELLARLLSTTVSSNLSKTLTRLFSTRSRLVLSTREPTRKRRRSSEHLMWHSTPSSFGR